MVTELEQAECDEFLRQNGTGVMSLTNGADTYAVPESFGYDGDSLYFQLVYDADTSQKMAFIEMTETVTFTTYTETPAKSVLARGSLEPVPDAEETLAATAISENAELPTLNVSPVKPPAELTYEFYRLVPDVVSGRKLEPYTK